MGVKSRDRGPAPRIGQALELLQAELRALVASHPWGHLLNGARRELDLRLRLPTTFDEQSLKRATEETHEALWQGIHSLVAQRLTYRPGRVFCLRCSSGDCEHGVPGDSREVFAGYGATGMPRFLDFGQRLLELHDPRVAGLYEESPRLLAVVSTEADLTRELLSPFRDREHGYRLHGQVAAGWYSLQRVRGGDCLVAVSLQVVSSRVGRHRRRFGLNVVGLAPGKEPLETVYDPLGEIPWAAAARWGQEVLSQIEDGLGHPTKVRTGPLKGRIEGLLAGLARRLEKAQRANHRRTHHAEVRRRQDQRPTHMALSDFARARPDEVLLDTRRDTVIVLGERGRAHVFSREGKLVTSIRYSPAAIVRRRENGRWRDATQEEITRLKECLEGGSNSPDSSS